MTRAGIRKLLFAAADTEYKEFSDRIVNCDTAPSIGIRVPRLRQLAKQLAAEDWEQYLNELEAPEDIPGGAAPVMYQEEHMLQGMLIGYAKMTREQRTGHLDRWVPGILSWSDCDCCVSGFKFMKKDQDFWYSYVTRWLESGREFEVRFALIALMGHFVNDGYIERVLDIFSADYGADAPYYIRMAQAWALCECFIKYRGRTLRVFEAQELEPWVHNKAIQKCRESYRVSDEDKERLKALKK